MKYDAMVMASGRGERAKLGYNKVFFRMKNSKTILENACSLFVEDEDCRQIIIVTNEENFADVFENEKIVKVCGGKERQNSVNNGLKLVKSDYVLIHDGARPYLRKEMLEEVKKTVFAYDACILAKKSTDTVKVVKDGVITDTLDRETIYLAETPQAFRTSLIREAFEKGMGKLNTDDAALVEALGHEVRVVADLYNNTKLTREIDFENI